MTEIPKIGVNSIGIESVRTYIINAPTINTPNVPVVVPMGFPVVNIPSTRPYFWHCVGSTCNRFSFGFRIEEVK